MPPLKPILNVEDVSSWRLCVGCGACVPACAKGRVLLRDVVEEGIRPFFDGPSCDRCGECLAVCPGYEMRHEPGLREAGSLQVEMLPGWGPVQEIWEGFATDPDLRFRSSSGGAASALAIHCLVSGKADGVVHVAADPKAPWRNRTVVSSTAEDISARVGSRYSPASPCQGFGIIETGPGSKVFIGKPCDAAALRKSIGRRPGLGERNALSISIFCAGTPSTRGTLDLIRTLGIEREDGIEGFRYRGHGWPGNTAIELRDRQAPSPPAIPYSESWGFLQQYRPFRCYLCPDGTGEFADIACGDPWYRDIAPGEPGYSLIVVRTEKGRAVLREAVSAGYLSVSPVGSEILEASQANLLAKRKSIKGRLMALSLLGIPTPTLGGFSLDENWKTLPVLTRIRTFLGTLRRAIVRGYRNPLPVERSGTDRA